MDKYELLNQIGDGTFGSVAKAVSRKTGQLVAIKKMKQKYYTWDECVKLPEVDVVRRIHGHPNIVKLREVIRENNELFFVFEYMDGDLLGVIKKAKQMQRPEDAAFSPAVPYPTIKNYIQQILQSLAYLHKRGYFHRDMKPENLLVRREESGTEVVKLADFGLVKEVRARPPFSDYVSTRWYRAPELLLQDRAYSSPVDIWAAGCIMAELITTRPLFPGSNEVDQLFRIMSTLGSPTEKTWPGGIQLGRKIRYTFPSIQGCGLAAVMPKHLPAQALDLMSQMLTYDPKVRPTAEQCLQHPFFSVGIDESSGPSVGAMQQLASASRRLQQLQQQPSPQSAPPAFGASAEPTAGDKDGKWRRSSDTSPSLQPVSGQKFYIVGGGAKMGGESAEGSPSPLRNDPGFGLARGSGTFHTASGAFNDGSSADKSVGPQRSPQDSTPAQGAASSKSVSPPPPPSNVLSGMKGLHLANLRSNALKSLNVAGAKSPVGGRAQRNSIEPNSTGSSAKVTVPKGKPTARSAQEDVGAVDIDGLMEEFASEISGMGLSAQKRPSAVGGAGGGDVRRSSALASQDPVAALLSNSRYKNNAPIGSSGLAPLKSTSNPIADRTSGGLNAKGEKGLQYGAQRKASLGVGPGGHGSPLSPALAVTPSIKALLAKHRKGSYSTANK